MSANDNRESMAELVGILLGDGSISRRNPHSSGQNRIKITLNSIDDRSYIKPILALFEQIFGVVPKVRFRKNENTVDLLLFNRKIVDLLVDKIGLQLSPKWDNAVIPKKFLSSSLSAAVLRGYFDTDGSVVRTNNNGTLYPRLEMKICPSPIQDQFISILRKRGFHFLTS